MSAVIIFVVGCVVVYGLLAAIKAPAGDHAQGGHGHGGHGHH